MDRSEAGNIVGFLLAAYPREALEEESVAVWTADIALLADAEIAAEAARQISRGSERFPSIYEFRTTYRALAESKRLDTPAIDPIRNSKIPTWVQVWYWLRRLREPVEARSLPQQREGLADEPFLTLNEYEGFEIEWREAGSPRLRRLGEAVVLR